MPHGRGLRIPVEKKQRRTWTPEEKTEIVLAGLRGDRSVRDVCREYEITEASYYQWRDRLLEGGKDALRRPNEKRADCSCSSAGMMSAGEGSLHII